MCFWRVEGIVEKPYDFSQPRLITPNPALCQEECYYVHGVTDEKFCTECIDDEINQNESYYVTSVIHDDYFTVDIYFFETYNACRKQWAVYAIVTLRYSSRLPPGKHDARLGFDSHSVNVTPSVIQKR